MLQKFELKKEVGTAIESKQVAIQLETARYIIRQPALATVSLIICSQMHVQIL